MGGEVLYVRDTGVAVELSVKDQSQSTVLEFDSSSDRTSWTKYLELAVEVLTPPDERAALDAIRADYKQREIEERRILNEERKKKLSENLGMRFTVEAMMRANERTGQKR